MVDFVLVNAFISNLFNLNRPKFYSDPFNFDQVSSIKVKVLEGLRSVSFDPTSSFDPYSSILLRPSIKILRSYLVLRSCSSIKVFCFDQYL